MKEVDKMIYDLDEVKEMFADADSIIKERPELLSMHIDDIFDEFDKTPEMRHIRWGIMTRAKMTEIKEYTSDNIIDFMTNITKYDLLCEYIGYVLQTEKHISLIKLLIEAYKNSVHREMLPFVEPCLEYEQECCVDKIDIILDILGSVNDISKSRLVHGYCSLISKTNNEEFIFEKYFENYSEVLESIVGCLAGGLYPEKEEIAKKWICKYMEEEKAHCKKAGIHLIHSSLTYTIAIFEDYFEVLEKLSEDQEYWERLIGVYIQYIENENNMLYRKKIKERLIRVKDGSLQEKRICVQKMIYKVKRVNEYLEIIENIIQNPFDKDRIILESLDYYFDYLLDLNLVKTVNMLYKVYEVNGLRTDDEFLEYLSQASIKLNHNQEELLEIWWNKFLHGSISNFFLSIEIFRRILSLGKLENFLCEKAVSKADALCLLKGVFLYTIDEKKIANLSFIIAACIKNNELFSDYCIENIFVNYPGALVEAAQKYIDNENIYKKVLAEYIIDYYELFDEKIKKGYADKDFVPTTDRRVVYQKFMVEHNKEILKSANEQSIFANLFPSRKMKYGRRIAFLQIYKKEEYNYSVSEYTRNTFSAELPKCFINDPMRYVYMRADYLKEREKNAINS